MHQALRISELMDQISWHTDRSSLPSLALTCHAFEGPALDALWRDLRSIEPLVNCIPGELILDTKAWAIFRKYASRVHSITQFGDLSPIIGHIRMLMLSCPYPSSTMFPKLRCLNWGNNQTHLAIEFLRMAFVPSLVSLDLETSLISPALMLLLSKIGTACPNLTSFQINYLTLNQEMAPILTEVICQLHRLSVLTVCELEDKGMAHIMQLQSLKELWLYIGPSDLRRTGLSSQSLSLEHLESLGLQDIKLDHITDFLRSLRTVRSKRIAAMFSNAFEQHSNSILGFCAMLVQQCDNDTLEGITLCEQSYDTFCNVSVQRSDFSSLYLLRNLTCFDIAAACTISISDNELSELVEAWPKLKTLKLSYYRDSTMNVLPTFHGLINVLGSCPDLVSLSLVIDATQLDGIDVESPSIYNDGLQELALGNSLIDSPVDVALVLSSLFPNLPEVNLAHWIGTTLGALFDEEGVMESWTLVNHVLRGFRMVVRTRRWGNYCSNHLCRDQLCART